MIIDRFESNLGEIIFTYMPVWEMFFSMHVLANPEHHGTRKSWVEKIENEFPEIVSRLRKQSSFTDNWNMIIDSPCWSEFRQLEIEEFIEVLRKKNICQWNEITEYAEIKLSVQERDTVLNLIEAYYQQIYKREELMIRPGLVRVLRREAVRCREHGLTRWAKHIHSRLIVTDDMITYIKNKEFRYQKADIERIFVTASTFVDPHLWMCQTPHEIEIVKRLPMEEIAPEIPEDFTVIFKALSDGTRLKIVRCLLQKISTTQKIGEYLGISEATVSKHLKILHEAGLVSKEKRGYFVEYEFQIEKINYLPYLFYETMRI